MKLAQSTATTATIAFGYPEERRKIRPLSEFRAYAEKQWIEFNTVESERRELAKQLKAMGRFLEDNCLWQDKECGTEKGYCVVCTTREELKELARELEGDKVKEIQDKAKEAGR